MDALLPCPRCGKMPEKFGFRNAYRCPEGSPCSANQGWMSLRDWERRDGLGSDKRDAVVKAADFLRAALFSDKPDASIQEAACNNLWDALAALKSSEPANPKKELCNVCGQSWKDCERDGCYEDQAESSEPAKEKNLTESESRLLFKQVQMRLLLNECREAFEKIAAQAKLRATWGISLDNIEVDADFMARKLADAQEPAKEKP